MKPTGLGARGGIRGEMLAAGFWLGLTVGVFVGAAFGLVLGGLMCAAADRDSDRYGPKRPDR